MQRRAKARATLGEGSKLGVRESDADWKCSEVVLQAAEGVFGIDSEKVDEAERMAARVDEPGVIQHQVNDDTMEKQTMILAPFPVPVPVHDPSLALVPAPFLVLDPL